MILGRIQYIRYNELNYRLQEDIAINDIIYYEEQEYLVLEISHINIHTRKVQDPYTYFSFTRNPYNVVFVDFSVKVVEVYELKDYRMIGYVTHDFFENEEVLVNFIYGCRYDIEKITLKNKIDILIS